MTYRYLTALLLSLLFVACKSPQKVYNQGDFTGAIERSVRKLQRDPNDSRSIQVLRAAYNEAVAYHEEQIRNLLAGSADTRFEQALSHYNSLQYLYTTIRQYPGSSKAVQATDYAAYQETYRNKAAELRVEQGRSLMAEDNKRAYQEAFRHFDAALAIKPGDATIRRLHETAYERAVTNVLVLPMDTYSGFYYTNGPSMLRNFQERIIRTLNRNIRSEFVRYMSQWDASSQGYKADETLEMRLGRIRIGQPYDQVEQRRVEKEVVVKETVYKKDSVVKEYAKVSALITTTRRILVSEAGLLLTARDGEGRVLWSDEFGGEHRDEVRFVTYSGDERALGTGDKELVSKHQPGNQLLPREEQVIDNLLHQIQGDLATRLRRHYVRTF